MISVSEWIELMKMLSDPNSVINAKEFEQVRIDVELWAMQFHPGASCGRELYGGAHG